MRVRHPDRRHSKLLREGLVGQRAAEIRQGGGRLSGRRRDRGAHLCDPGVVGIGPGGVEEAAAHRLDLDILEAFAIEMGAQGRTYPVAIHPQDIAQLAGGGRAAGDGVHRRLGTAATEGEHVEARKAEDLMRPVEARLPPAGIRLRRLGAVLEFDLVEQGAHARGDLLRAPFLDANAAMRIGQARDGVGAADAGVFQQPGPVARVMRLVARLAAQVEILRAARAEENRRPLGADARPVRRDQHIRRGQLGMGLGGLAQPLRPALLAHLDEHLDIEAQSPAGLEHNAERGEIDAVLTLVVHGAAPLEAAVARLEPPGIEPRLPVALHPAQHVAMAGRGRARHGSRRAVRWSPPRPRSARRCRPTCSEAGRSVSRRSRR